MKRSFSLIEVLVSLSIIGIISVFLIPAIYNSLEARDRNNDYYRLLLRSQEIIEGYKAEYFNGIDHVIHEDCQIIEKDCGTYMEVEFTVSHEGKEMENKLILPKNIGIFE